VLAIGLACAKQERTMAAETLGALDPAPRAAAAGERVTTAPCPATGLWSACAVFERLDRAGLAPRRDSTAATEPPLTRSGTLLRIGRSELELYVYPDVAAREREEATLERGKYIAGDKPVGMESRPTLIPSANLLVILHSRNDHQRERVFDAITAGPPQPAQP
jgi:hypothetical protein